MIVQDAIDLIKHYEGFSAEPYQDPGGIWTQGFGFTGHNIKPDSMPLTLDQAENILANKLSLFEAQVRPMIKSQTTDNQLGALVSFTYNLGVSALSSSTLMHLHNEGKYQLAQAEFCKWNHANGVVLAGLTARREAEANLYGTSSNVII